MKREAPGLSGAPGPVYPPAIPTVEDGPAVFTRKRDNGVPELPPGAVLLDKRGVVVRAPVDREVPLPAIMYGVFRGFHAIKLVMLCGA